MDVGAEVGNVKNNHPELAPRYARAGYSSPTRSSPAVRDDFFF